MSDTSKEKLNQMLDQDLETDRGATSPDGPPKEFPKEFPKHHPAGLWVLFTTEMWERFCYYGMRAFLTLYLCSTVMSETNPGLGWSQQEAYNFYGYFTGLVYLMPLLCGWIADYFIGQHRSMIFGGALIAIGEFTLCGTEFVRKGAGVAVTYQSDPLALATFFTGLMLIIIGTGFFKPCVSVMVGQLYGEGDPRRDGGFTIFYMGINLGAMLSPLIAGTVAEKIGWEWGFFVAGLGMIFGLITYSVFRPKYLAHLGLPPVKGDPLKNVDEETLAKDPELAARRQKAIEKAQQDQYERTRPLTKVDLDKVYVILAMSLFTIAFWLSFEQAGSSLNVFAKRSTNRNVTAESLPKVMQAPLIENEYASDLDDAIKGMESVKKDIAVLLQKDELKEETETKKERITPFGKLKRFFTSDKEKEDKKEVNIDDLVEELLQKAQATHPKAFLTVDEQGQVVETPVVIATKDETTEQTEQTGPTAQKTFSKADLQPNALTTHLIYVAGYSLTEKELEKLTGLLSDYRKAKAGLEKSIDRQKVLYRPGLSSHTFPATWYQSVNAMGIVCFAPLFAFMWVFLGARKLEPSTPVKFGIGLLLVSLSFIVMVPGAIEAKNTLGLAAPYWLLISYVLATWGELCLSPVGLSMVSKLAPLRFASLLMGFWFISSAIANVLGGKLAALFGAESAEGGGLGISLVFGNAGGMADFFLLMAIVPAITGIIVLLTSSKLKKMMHGAG